VPSTAEEVPNVMHILQDPSWLDYMSAVSPVAIIISAGAAFYAASRAVKHQRSIARRRATLDIILKLEADPLYLKAAATFRDVRDGGNLSSLFRQTSQRAKEEFLQVQTFLNYYEMICCGILEDTLDELFYFQWYRGAFIHHWHNSKEFVDKARERADNERIFQRFELFATSWDEGKFVTITKKKPSWYIDHHQDVATTQD